MPVEESGNLLILVDAARRASARRVTAKAFAPKARWQLRAK